MKRHLSLAISLMFVAVAAMANCTNRQQAGKASGNGMQQAAEQTAEKETAPDFTLDDINGKHFSLSSLRGRIVVIDFWGSWCGWCIKGMPEMKKYYEKYKDRLEIVGVDCGDTKEGWKAAVEKYGLPWIHVYNPRGLGDITGLYSIQGFPTKIIVGKNGEILKTVIGEDPQFYTALDEIMKQ